MTPTADVAAVVDAFAAAHGSRLADPEYVRARCVEFSEEFVDDCLAAGIPAKLIHGAQHGELPAYPGVRLLMSGHSAALVANGDDDLVIDWTAHQFDPAAPVPLVTDLDRWRETWEPVGPAV